MNSEVDSVEITVSEVVSGSTTGVLCDYNYNEYNDSTYVFDDSMAQWSFTGGERVNIVDDGIFIVISLPVSAFKNTDNDNDDKLSAEEFILHCSIIARTVHEKIILSDTKGKVTLQEMILAPVTSHHYPQAQASQLIVMGRYTIVSPNSELQYKVDLFGTMPSEKTIEITVTNKQHNNKQVIKLSPKKTTPSLFQREL